jgi:predicted flap endonuclease-1-like 5' DNA nuclease
VRGASIQSGAVIWILLVIAVAVAFAIGWRYGARCKHEAPSPDSASSAPDASPASPTLDGERARIIRSYETEASLARSALRDRDAGLARERSETARYRQLVIDLENNAPPPLLDSPTTPDDLKMIVGVGPVLERMLYQMGITTYRQIARWSERDIDEVDARLHEFPGRIRRDEWVTQARALHQSKYGEPL